MAGFEETERIATNRIGSRGWMTVALAVAAVGAVGSLWLSMGMGLKACPLCLYQRAFILATVGVLTVGLFAESRHTGLVNALALPAATGGFGVAAFHEYLELTGKLECPAGVLGWGTAPQQSLVVFGVLVMVLLIPLLWRHRTSSPALAALGLVLGLLFALGTVQSAPPMPAPPDSPYEHPLDMCRPPYRALSGEAPSR